MARTLNYLNSGNMMPRKERVESQPDFVAPLYEQLTTKKRAQVRRIREEYLSQNGVLDDFILYDEMEKLIKNVSRAKRAIERAAIALDF